eukprot:gnl/MRDRNA2_/MRDRNA2_90456_c0_seq1.p1 gnl/MRDRNA2_/MRDRNA2_90456_c0~~gnl/MRDRNA2_/MRDRNA2_90456_c0_seq1.p1  ORF type:complete len:450 (+),score=73.44 gnl/MRDRNA2_/MRDRNA2_90456_c0_seq1:159-1352(+)
MPSTRDGGAELKERLQRQRKRVSDAIRAAGPCSTAALAKENLDPQDRNKMEDSHNQKSCRALTPRRVIASIPVSSSRSSLGSLARSSLNGLISSTVSAAGEPHTGVVPVHQTCLSVRERQGQLDTNVAVHRSSTPRRRHSNTFANTSQARPSGPPKVQPSLNHCDWKSQASMPAPLYPAPVPDASRRNGLAALTSGISIPMSWLVIASLIALLICSVSFGSEKCPDSSTWDKESELSAWGVLKSWFDHHLEAAYMVWKLNTTHRHAAHSLYIWSQENWQLFPSIFCCILGGMPLTRAIMALWSKAERVDLNNQRAHPAQMQYGQNYAPFPMSIGSVPAMQPIQMIDPMHSMQGMLPAHHAAMNTYGMQMPSPYMQGPSMARDPLGWIMPVWDDVTRQ